MTTTELLPMRCNSCMRILGISPSGHDRVTYCDEACAAFPPAKEQETRNLYILHLRVYNGLSWRMLASMVGITSGAIAPIMRHYDPVNREK